MKKLMMVFVMVFMAQFGFAQECSKTCDTKKNSYVENGDVIEAVLYHDNGMIAQTGNYTKENKLDGEWISYDANGNKTSIAQYDNGKKIGTWKFYEGDTLREVTYADSKIAKVNTWKMTDTRVVSNK